MGAGVQLHETDAELQRARKSASLERQCCRFVCSSVLLRWIWQQCGAGFVLVLFLLTCPVPGNCADGNKGLMGRVPQSRAVALSRDGYVVPADACQSTRGRAQQMELLLCPWRVDADVELRIVWARCVCICCWPCLQREHGAGVSATPRRNGPLIRSTITPSTQKTVFCTPYAYS